MDRVFGLSAEADLERLMRAAERAGVALGCIDVDDPPFALPGDAPTTPWTFSRLGAWAVTAGLAVAFLIL